MLCTYDRYMREFRIKRTAAKYGRDDARDEREVVPSVHVALIIKRAAETAGALVLSTLLLTSCTSAASVQPVDPWSHTTVQPAQLELQP